MQSFKKKTEKILHEFMGPKINMGGFDLHLIMKTSSTDQHEVIIFQHSLVNLRSKPHIIQPG